MAGEKMGNKVYRPAWRSFLYPDILSMVAFFIVACVISFYFDIGKTTMTILWLAVLVVAVVIFLHMFVKRIGSYLVVRHDEVAFERGILNRRSTEIGFEDIRTVDVTQTILQRIFKLGNILIASSGTSGYEINLKNMPDPNVIRDEIQGRKRSMMNKAETAQANAETENA